MICHIYETIVQFAELFLQNLFADNSDIHEVEAPPTFSCLHPCFLYQALWFIVKLLALTVPG